MKLYKFPDKENWEALMKRPTFDNRALGATVSEILKRVKSDKDMALRYYSEKFDHVLVNDFVVSQQEIKDATYKVKEELKDAIQLAYNNLYKFHAAQKENSCIVETMAGVSCWRQSSAIDKVGLYIPGGSAPLFSTILMLGIPARIAGCSEVVLCTPPQPDGSVHPAILYTADRVGITKICRIGGAQAIAAMAYGTESVPGVYKIFGPGNQYVTKAKEMVQLDGIAIDMPAGPSEVLVIADSTCQPSFVAADLLSQAEHGEDSQVVLLSNSEQVIEEVLSAVNNQLKQLPRKTIAQSALDQSFAVLLKNTEDCLAFSNLYAPEHLIIASENAFNYKDKITNAGSVFLGNYSCESAGDYASGTNHTLPTNGFARSHSGVSLDSFVKKITFQQISASGIQAIGPAIEHMAEAEQLFAHKNSVTIRLNSLNNEE